MTSNVAMQQRYPYEHLWPETARRPLLGFAAWSGTGKTTLLEAVIPRLRDAGLRLALIKHAHHEFDVDYPGKDSYKLRKAGADQVLVTSGHRWALMQERAEDHEPVLVEEIARLDQESIDLLLVEGFRHERFPKIELLRDPEASDPPLYRNDDAIIAVATPEGLDVDTALPRLSLDDPDMVVRFILEHIVRAR